MANSLIKSLGIALGGGLALGVGIKIGQSTAPQPIFPEPQDLNPLLERIENIEEKTSSIEAHLKEPGPVMTPPLAELEQQVFSQGSEVIALREMIANMGRDNDTKLQDLAYAVNSIEDKLPELIERSTQPKFEEMGGRMKREIQETASQTLEAFADRIQGRVVEKITSLEGDLTHQREAINELRDYSLKTESQLQRLLEGVDKLTDKFKAPPEPQRAAPRPEPLHAEALHVEPPRAETVIPAPASPRPIAESQIPPAPAPAPAPVPPPPASPRPASFAPPAPQPIQVVKPGFPVKIELGEAADVRPPREPFPSSATRPAMPPPSGTTPLFEELTFEKPRSRNGVRVAAVAGGGLALLALGVGVVEYSGYIHKAPTTAHAANTKPGQPVAPTDSLDTNKLSAQTDLLDQARGYAQKKEYDKAEDLYRSILKTDPGNAEVKRLLASVLFRQDKIDESAKVLNSISEDKQHD